MIDFGDLLTRLKFSDYPPQVRTLSTLQHSRVPFAICPKSELSVAIPAYPTILAESRWINRMPWSQHLIVPSLEVLKSYKVSIKYPANYQATQLNLQFEVHKKAS
jgi:hypothetical protein